jgi:predicted nucleic acid-binding protein
VTRSFFDTNVLVYLFDNSEPEKKARAQEALHREVAAGRAALSTQVLQEFYVNVTRKLATPLPTEVAEARVRDFSRLPLVRVDAPLILAAIARSRRMGFSFWDALILEAALAAGADRLLTEDLQHRQEIEGLRVENPFL